MIYTLAKKISEVCDGKIEEYNQDYSVVFFDLNDFVTKIIRNGSKFDSIVSFHEEIRPLTIEKNNNNNYVIK